jgi:hypothetical protein
MKERSTIYATVGQGISNWARMEGRIIHLAADLLDCNVEKAGVVFYSITNFHSWLGIIDELLALDKCLASAKRDWNQIATRLRKLNDVRVRLAHHTTWYTDHSQCTLALRPAREDRRKKSQGYAHLTATEILDFTNATTHMVSDLTDFKTRVRACRIAL